MFLLGHKLSDDAPPGNGPSDLEPLVNVQNLTVELRLRFDPEHPEGGRHVEVLGHADAAKVDEEGHAPHGEPVCWEEIGKQDRINQLYKICKLAVMGCDY